ncbi:MAG: bacillithiol biosynthesis cysteine-adding enzyme BshC [Bryobacteraceae bacterium]
MECSCVRQTDLPHTTRLFADYVYHPERVAGFYDRPHRNWEAYAEAARAVELPAAHRAALVEALGPANAGSAALETLARPGTVAVVTGQQVGLFSGPAYTIYKALTAVRLARELSARGIPAVPVFWLATEDHDFAEVNHVWVFDPEHRARKLEMPRASSGQPVGGVELADVPLAELRQALAGFPFAGEVVEMAASAYAPGSTMGAAFSALLRKVLGSFDMVQVDPLSPAVRELAAPTLRRAVEQAPELNAALLERNAQLTGAGYHAQVYVEASTSLVFLLENGRRLPLKRHGADYMQEGRRLTSAELSARAERLSPNALLRPVVQDSILPTVAYIGGPAELAYLAQSQVLYRRLLGHMPVALPRTGFTLLDARACKLMRRYELRLMDFFHGFEPLRDRIAARLVPPELHAVVAESRAAVENAADRLATELARFDPSLEKALEKSRAKMRYQIAKMERRVGREAMLRDARAEGDAAYLYGLVCPERHLQERLYGILPFLAAHGPQLVDRLYNHVRLECPDHQLAEV